MEHIQLNAGAASAELLPSRGGLLSRLALVAPGGAPVDLLYLPDNFDAAESGWPGGGAPLLFPFAGRVFHQGTPLLYEWGSRMRAMPLHGFSYASAWAAEQLGPDHVRLALQSGPATHVLYPYDFRVEADYQLSPASLTLTITTHNLGARENAPQDMPVSAGWHPYFLTPPAGLASLRLAIAADEMIAVTPAGAAGKAAAIPADADFGCAAPWLASQIIGQLRDSRASLIDQGAGRAIDITWDAETTQYVVVWTGDPERYYCVEPWMGAPDAVTTGLGLTQIAPGASLAVKWRIALRAT